MSHDLILESLTLILTVPIIAVNTYFILRIIKELIQIHRIGKKIKSIERKMELLKKFVLNNEE